MTAPSPVIGLSAAHYAELSDGSAITEQRIRNRCYQSVTADQLPSQFADYQRRDGLLIPIRSVRGEIESFQLKPHQPRIGKNGKPIRYETAANAPQVIDVPESVLPLLSNPKHPLVITEGAKKVDAALSHNMLCTIGLQGVFGWRGKNEHGGSTALADWEHIALNNRVVIIAFDSDVMMKESVRSALDRLSAFLRGKGACVTYIVMPNLPDGSKCGIDDWFASGRTRDDLAALAVDTLPTLTPAPIGTSRLVARSMNLVETKQIDWLWPGWLPKGMLSLLGGYAGDGKSTLSVALAAAISTGGTLPDGTSAPITNTLLVLAEDDVSHVVKGRLEVHGVDATRVHTLDHVEDADGTVRGFHIRTDVPLLRQLVDERQIGLIVIDPLSSVMSSSDRNSEGDVRDAMSPLIKMAEETGCAVLGIMHIGKNDGQTKAYQKLMGSTAYTALARTVWMVSDLPSDYQAEGEPVRKMIGVAKSNYAVPPAPLQFRRPLDGALQWLGESPLGIDDVFSWRKKSESSERGPSDTERAEVWLEAFMNGKRMLSSEIEAAAKGEGLGFPTVRKAKKRLGITSVREQHQWYWQPAVTEGESVA